MRYKFDMTNGIVYLVDDIILNIYAKELNDIIYNFIYSACEIQLKTSGIIH